MGRPRGTRRLTAAVLPLAALGVAGCGDEDPEPRPRTQAPIVVTEPRAGATVRSPMTISGTANVFEATVSVQILDAKGRKVADEFTTATCGSGCRGDYTTSVRYSVKETQPGTVKVFESSAEDGRAVKVVRVPVTLSR